MTQLVNPKPVPADLLDTLYAPVADEMRQVEQILRRELRSDYPFVDELAQYGCLLGGKRMRPALLLLSAKAAGGLNEDHLTLAAVVEMIHTATLIHDDVLDEADVRRHLATVNARWNDETSVLLGDYLYTHSFYLASGLESTYACRAIGRATNVLCEGELRQIGSRADYSLSEEDYLSIIRAKTASLCACCCQLGAHFAGSDEAGTLLFEEFGNRLGVAFQIADDLLDLLGDEKDTGKSLGTDLIKQKPTLPVIHLLGKANSAEREEILGLLRSTSDNRPALLASWLARYRSIDYARERAEAFAADAIDQLDHLPSSPAKEALTTMAQFAARRAR